MSNKAWHSKIPWFLALLGLCLPLVYQVSEFHWVRGLRGFQPEPERVMLNLGNVQNNSYQAYAESQLKYDLRFKPFYIRLNNELKYSLYNKFTLPDILEGKEGWLFSPFSLPPLYGEEWVDKEKIDQTSSKLSQSLDSLKKKGTSFLFVIAPSKAAVLPELLPDREKAWTDTLPAYHYWKDALEKNGIPLLDTYALFNKWKNREGYEAFTKGGFHWSLNASYRVWDTLYTRVEEATGIDMPDYSYDTPIITPIGKKADTDLVDASNLFWSQLIQQNYIYPQMVKEGDQEKKRPSVIGVGDSFFWNLHAEKFTTDFFAEDFIFWYYYKEVYPAGPGYLRKQNVDLNLQDALKGRDMVIFMIFLNNMNGCCWGFMEDLSKIMLAKPE